MTRKKYTGTNDIIGLAEKYFIKSNANRITFFRADKRYKFKEVEGGKLVFANKWVSKKDWDGMTEKLTAKPDYSKTQRGILLPREIEKVHFKPTKLKQTVKLESSREKHTAVYIAYTKDQIEQFLGMKKGKKIPIQLEDGKRKEIIDLKKPYREQNIIQEWKEEVSP